MQMQSQTESIENMRAIFEDMLAEQFLNFISDKASMI